MGMDVVITPMLFLSIRYGCGVTMLMNDDEDGVGDNRDAFPFDSSEWSDFDLDGIGDNTDVCPLEEGYSLIPLGCVDSDGDGYGDRVDAFPSIHDEWNDSDGDGVGDARISSLLIQTTGQIQITTHMETTETHFLSILMNGMTLTWTE